MNASLQTLVGADLARFKIVQVFGVYSLNEYGIRCGLPLLLVSEAAAKDYVAREKENPWGAETLPVLVLTDGTVYFIFEHHEAMAVFANADAALTHREMVLAAWNRSE